MSATNIVYNASTDIRRRTADALRKGRESREETKAILAILQTGISGDGSDATQYTRSAAIGGYVDNDTAYASWLELNAVYAQQVSIAAATDQACAKHGV